MFLLIFKIQIKTFFARAPRGSRGKIKKQYGLYISTKKAVISVCLSVCIITQEPLDRFVSNFDGGILEVQRNVF